MLIVITLVLWTHFKLFLLHGLEKKDEDNDCRPPQPLVTADTQRFHSLLYIVKKLLMLWSLPRAFWYV